MWISSLLVLELILLLWYVRHFLRATNSWKQNPETGRVSSSRSALTVVIAMRNEAHHIDQLMRALSHQTHRNFEVLLVDDHSTDGSFEKALDYGKNLPYLNCLRLEDGKKGKKSALAYGVSLAKSEWILCTDADCTFQKDWIATMLGYAENTQKVFVSGPVQFNAGDTWFTRWQALEFSGLISLGAAALFQKSPTMCNGANILYQKAAFNEVGGYSGNEGIASGDDQFLMHRIFERYPEAVGFCKSNSAIVYTEPVSTWRKFVSQRIRWASKNGQFERKAVSWEMIGVWMMSFVILFNIILGFVNPLFFMASLLVLIGKGLVEYRFYSATLGFYGGQALKKNFWVSELFQVIYVFCIGLLGKFVRYEWKGRI